MQKRYCILLSFLVLSLSFFPLFGCSTTRSLVKKITPHSPLLKKRVMVAPLIDQAGIGPERTARIDDDFVELLKKSPHLLIFRTD